MIFLHSREQFFHLLHGRSRVAIRVFYQCLGVSDALSPIIKGADTVLIYRLRNIKGDRSTGVVCSKSVLVKLDNSIHYRSYITGIHVHIIYRSLDVGLEVTGAGVYVSLIYTFGLNPLGGGIAIGGKLLNVRDLLGQFLLVEPNQYFSHYSTCSLLGGFYELSQAKPKVSLLQLQTSQPDGGL